MIVMYLVFRGGLPPLPLPLSSLESGPKSVVETAALQAQSVGLFLSAV